MRLSVKKLTLAAVCLIPQQDAPFPAELDRYIAQVLVDWQIPGLAIAVVRNDSVLVAKGYGVRELGKPGRVDANTVFDAASLSKSFTATAVGILVDRGILRWDDPVHRYLPDLVLPDTQLTATLTLRDFLSHGTGLESANMMWAMTGIDRAEVLRRVRYLRVLAPPRREMIYNNVGYTVAGEAVAASLHTTLEDLIASLIIRPLRLTSTTATYERAAQMPNLASAHATIAGRQQPIRRETQRHTIDAAGGIQTTVTDLARWMRLHLNNGVLDGRRYVSDSTMRQMHARQIIIPTTPAMRAARLVQDSVAGYGLGWQVMDYRGHPLLWHSGNGDGQIAYMALLPRDHLGVVVLVNTWSAPAVHGALANRIMDTYLGLGKDSPLRDWAGEARARIPAPAIPLEMARVPVPLPLAAFTGRYDNPLFGPVWISEQKGELTLQMGTGQIADLEFHGEPGFMVTWRDPLYRENFGTHVRFTVSGDSVTSLSIRINRDEFTARRSH